MAMTNKQKVVINVHDADTNYQQVDIIGEIDRDTLPGFREEMEVFLAGFSGNNLLLNLEKLGFINSEGIGYLSDIHNRLVVQNKNVYTCSASARIVDIFQLVGLNQIIQHFPNIDGFLNKIKTK